MGLVCAFFFWFGLALCRKLDEQAAKQAERERLAEEKIRAAEAARAASPATDGGPAPWRRGGEPIAAGGEAPWRSRRADAEPSPEGAAAPWKPRGAFGDRDRASPSPTAEPSWKRAEPRGEEQRPAPAWKRSEPREERPSSREEGPFRRSTPTNDGAEAAPWRRPTPTAEEARPASSGSSGGRYVPPSRR